VLTAIRAGGQDPAWIKGRHQLTTEQVRHGDLVRGTRWARNGLADRASTTAPTAYVLGDVSAPDHVHYVPLRAYDPAGARTTWWRPAGAWTATPPHCPACGVMGPCAAMGRGRRATPWTSRGRGSVHERPTRNRLRGRLAANVGARP